MSYKITPRRKPELVGRKVKRTGVQYFEVAYTLGGHWHYKDFNTRLEANNFVRSLA